MEYRRESDIQFNVLHISWTGTTLYGDEHTWTLIKNLNTDDNNIYFLDTKLFLNEYRPLNIRLIQQVNIINAAADWGKELNIINAAADWDKENI